MTLASSGRIALATVAVCVSLLGFSTWLPAQPPTTMPAGGETIDVHLLNLDVRVSDRDGRPIDDLERDDFAIVANGRRIEPTHFRRADDDGPPVPETLIVFLDELHLSATTRNAVIPPVQDLVRRHLRHDLSSAMVVAFDGRLHMLQNLTTDASRVVVALAQAERRGEVGSDARATKRAAQEAVRESMRLLAGRGGEYRAGELSIRATLTQLRNYGARVQAETGATLDAMLTVLDTLAPVPGRKTFLHLADELVVRPLETIAETLQRRQWGQGTGIRGDTIERAASTGTGTGDFNSESIGSDTLDGVAEALGLEGIPTDTGSEIARFQQDVARLSSFPRLQHVAAVANAANVTIHTLKPPSGAASSSGYAERVADQDNDRTLSDTLHALEYLARSTAGSSLLGVGDVEEFLIDIERDRAHLYSLAFPPTALDGEERQDLQIEVARRGARIRAPQVLLVRPFDVRLVERTTGTLILGWDDNRHGLEIVVAEQHALGNGTVDVDVDLIVPLGAVTLLQRDGAHEGRVRFLFGARTHRGDREPVRQMEVPLSIPAADLERAREQDFAARVRLNLPPGRQTLAAGFWDEIGQSGSFLHREVNVRGDASDAGTDPSAR